MMLMPNIRSRRSKVINYYRAGGLRTIFLTGAVVLLAIFIVSLIIRYFTLGNVIITTDAKDTTIVISTSSGESLQEIRGSSLEKELPAGTYIATVQAARGFSSASQSFIIKPRQTLRYKINPPTAVSVEPVLPIYTLTSQAGSSILYYIDPSANLLARLDGSGRVSVVNETIKFESIQWSDSSFGVGLSDNDKLYAITNGILTRIPFSVKYSSQDRISFSLSKNKVLYVSIGKSLYRFLDINKGVLEKIYTSEHSILYMYGGSQDVAIVENLNPSGGHDDEHGEGSLSLVTVRKFGEPLRKDLGGLDVAVFAGSGADAKSNLLINLNDEIYDSSLKKIASLPHPTEYTPLVLNDNTILYSIRSQLWSYDLQSKHSVLLANAGIDEQIESLSASDDGSYVYMSIRKTTSESPNDGYIARVGLTEINHSVPDYVYALGIFFPSHTDQCYFYYTNFLRPTILITSYTNKTTCLDAVKEELIADQLPVKAFNIVFVNAGE